MLQIIKNILNRALDYLSCLALLLAWVFFGLSPLLMWLAGITLTDEWFPDAKVMLALGILATLGLGSLFLIPFIRGMVKPRRK